MPTPIVSVIITTFNRPLVLREAIKSVLDQNFSDLELIVVDDASPGEETAHTVSSFSDSRIRYIKNNTNKGGTASLNIGLRAATGKYVAILDDDDIWIDHEKLSKQIKFLDSHPEYVLVGTNAIIVDSGTKIEITRSNWPADDAEIRKTILSANPFAHSSVVYFRDKALSVNGYDEELPRGKDYDLILSLGMLGKIEILKDYSLMYREAVPNTKDLIARRLKDTRATAAVLWKHKSEYPNFSGAYMRVMTRVLAFRALSVLPFLYNLHRKS